MTKKHFLNLLTSCFSILALTACGYEGDIPVAAVSADTDISDGNPHFIIEIISDEMLAELEAIAGEEENLSFFPITRGSSLTTESVTIMFTTNEPISWLAIAGESSELSNVGFSSGRNEFPVGSRFVITNFPIGATATMDYNLIPHVRYIQDFVVNERGELELGYLHAVPPMGEWPDYFRIDVISDDELVELTNHLHFDYNALQGFEAGGNSNLLFTFNQTVYDVSLRDTELGYSSGRGGILISEDLVVIDTLGTELSLVVSNFPLSEINTLGFRIGEYDFRGFAFEHPCPNVVRMITVDHGEIIDGTYGQGCDIIDDGTDVDFGDDEIDLDDDDYSVQTVDPVERIEPATFLTLIQLEDWTSDLTVPYVTFDYPPVARSWRQGAYPEGYRVARNLAIIVNEPVQSIRIHSLLEFDGNFRILEDFYPLRTTEILRPGHHVTNERYTFGPEALVITRYIADYGVPRSAFSFVDMSGIRNYFLIYTNQSHTGEGYQLVPFTPYRN